MSNRAWNTRDYTPYQKIIDIQKEIVDLQKIRLNESQAAFNEKIASLDNEKINTELKNQQEIYIAELEKLVKKQEIMIEKQLDSDRLNTMYIAELHKLINAHEDFNNTLKNNLQEYNGYLEKMKDNCHKDNYLDKIIAFSILITLINLLILWWK